MTVRVFIGSSSEGTGYARAIEDVIASHQGYDVLPWQFAFRVGESYIESLIIAANSVDAAVFVATPDDHRRMRDRPDLVIRDNVLFEYGLFSGRLERFRTALAVVGNAVCPTDLQGVKKIVLPEKKEEDDWGHYKANIVAPKVREWLQRNFETSDLLALAKPMSYKCLESESDARKEGLFQKAARGSPTADYLVLRGRDLLNEGGEIAGLCKYGHKQLQVRILMLDFETLNDETFNRLKKDMDLQWNDDLRTERRLSKERLAFASTLTGRRVEHKLLPANRAPEIKLRLYRDCGFFTFYRKIGGEAPVQKRTVFCVDDRLPVSHEPRLLVTLHQFFNKLWDSV
jgi:hypothetical protein